MGQSRRPVLTKISPWGIPRRKDPGSPAGFLWGRDLSSPGAGIPGHLCPWPRGDATVSLRIPSLARPSWHQLRPLGRPRHCPRGVLWLARSARGMASIGRGTEHAGSSSMRRYKSGQVPGLQEHPSCALARRGCGAFTPGSALQPALAGCEAARRRLDHWSPPPPRPSSGRAGHAPVGYDPSPYGLPFRGWTLAVPWGLHSRERVPRLAVGTFSIGCWLRNTFQEEGRGHIGV